MALQSDDLTALGLGITADHPPIPFQPLVCDGIHLRCATSFTKGLPWGGFYLFRRPHVAAITQCLAPELARLKPSLTGATAHPFSGAPLHSPAPIEFIGEFPAAGAVEVALPGQTFLGATFAQAPVHRVTASIGFRGSLPQGERISGLIQFHARPAGVATNPLAESGATFRGGDVQRPGIRSPLRFGSVGAWKALICTPQGDRPATLEIAPPASSEYVILVVTHPAAALSVQAFDKGGREIVAASQPVSAGSPSIVTLSQAGLALIRLTCAKGEIGLHLLLHGSLARAPGPQRAVRMIAKDADTIVAETIISGRPGDVVTGEVNADRITAVEFHPVVTLPRSGTENGKDSLVAPPAAPPATGGSYAALVDLCWDTVANALRGRWERIANFPYPMALPVAEASYPCAGKPATRASAEAVALSRVRYGNPADWGGAVFSDLHAHLTKLVAGGPGGGAMHGRTDTFVDATLPPDKTPKLPGQNLLQLVQLASLDPAMAQIIGTYWVDDRIVTGHAYDYIFLADHGNSFAGQAAAALAAVNQTIPNDVDAWITFNHVAKPRPPLSAPARPRALVLPDTAVDGMAGSGRGAAGLTSDPSSPGTGYLASDAAVRYLAWRCDHGDDEPLVPVSASAYLPLNRNAPYLVGNASGAQTPNAPTNWPPFALHAVDRRLADGWYSYAISGINIWGQYSGLSKPAEWRQWAPAPQPEPWYYQHPAVDKQLHAFAVHILDKTPPPPPAAVEATALDPEDDVTYVQDGAYTAWWAATGEPWWNGLSDAERAAVLPLRVRWRWYPAQEEQHPNTREFRVYFNPLSVPPGPDRFDSVNWQDRIFVCGYNDHVTAVPQTANEGPYRQYEVLLPVAPPGSPSFAGVPMQPSLAQPIVYANISVSAADDRIHTDDQAKWNGTPWGGRYGNEGVLAAPAKLYRVWRALPAAPLSLLDDERVWATKADYHSHSFYTFRWAASAGLKAHAYAVMDATLFMVERAREDIAALSAADMDALETLWNPVPQALIDQLGGLRALKAAVSNEGLSATDGALRKQHDADWEAACAALSDGALRGLAALPLHEDSYVRQTTSPIDDADFTGPDDPAGHVPNAAWHAYQATFDGRARNRYFLRASYIDNAHNEGPLGPPSPAIYLPPAVPPRTPVIVKVTGGDRQATIAWTTANAEAGGRYILYRTDNDYRLRDVRLMDVVATVPAAALDPANGQAEWVDHYLPGGRTWHYCLVFVDADGRASAPSKAAALFAPDELPPAPPSWTDQCWMVQDVETLALLAWPSDGIIAPGLRPVLRLGWETSTDGPSFVISRSETRRPGWNFVTQGEGAAYPGGQGRQFSYIDPDADSTAALQYRIKVSNAAGAWSVAFATQRIFPPNTPPTVQ